MCRIFSGKKRGFPKLGMKNLKAEKRLWKAILSEDLKNDLKWHLDPLNMRYIGLKWSNFCIFWHTSETRFASLYTEISSMIVEILLVSYVVILVTTRVTRQLNCSHLCIIWHMWKPSVWTNDLFTDSYTFTANNTSKIGLHLRIMYFTNWI